MAMYDCIVSLREKEGSEWITTKYGQTDNAELTYEVMIAQ